MKAHKQFLVALSAILVLGFGVLTVAQGAEENEDQQKAEAQAEQQDKQKEQQDKQKEQQEEEEAAMQLKVFDLEHIDADQISSLLRRQFGQRDATARRRGRAAAFGFRGRRGQEEERDLRVVSDRDTGTLFIRGTEENLQQIERVIEAFDVPSGEISEGMEVGEVYVVPVQNADPSAVIDVLDQLDLDTQKMPLGETTLIAITAKDEEREQAKEVIEKLEQKYKETEDQPEQEPDDQGEPAEQDAAEES